MRVAELRVNQRQNTSPNENEEPEMIVEGYAIRYEEPAIFSYGEYSFSEIIDRGAVALADVSDVPFKYNHSDTVMIMARTTSGTLRLENRNDGLFITASLANTTMGRDLYELIKRGDISKMSFAFTTTEESWDRESKTRRILKIDKIYDVSAVDLPAYDTTSISARCKLHFDEVEQEKQDNEIRQKIKKQAIGE